MMPDWSEKAREAERIVPAAEQPNEPADSWRR
jgi:hypothetical protein